MGSTDVDISPQSRNWLSAFRRLFGPLGIPAVHEGLSESVYLYKQILGRADLIQALLVVLIILYDVVYVGQTTNPLVFIALLGYVTLVLTHRWLMIEGHIRNDASASIAFLIRVLVIMAATGVFLFLLYSRTDYLTVTYGQSTLWLLFIFANLTVMRRGSLRFLLASTLVAALMLVPSEWYLLEEYYGLAPGDAVPLIATKVVWVITLSAMLYGTLNLISERIPAFLVVQRLTNEWSQMTDARELADVVVVELCRRFGFDEAHVFLREGDDLRMISAATEKARNLVRDGFVLPLGEPGDEMSSLNAAAFLSGETVDVGDVLTDPKYARIFYPHQVFENTRSELVVPLKIGDDKLGTLDIMSHQENAFSVPTDRELMETVAGSLSAAMNNALNRQRLVQQQESLKVIDLISGSALPVIELRRLLTDIAERARKWSRADIVVVYEIVPEAQFQVRSGPHLSGKLFAEEIRMPESSPNTVTRVAELGKPVFADDVWDEELTYLFPSHRPDHRDFREREQIRSLVALPLFRSISTVAGSVPGADERQVIGVIFFNYREKQSFAANDELRQLYVNFANLASLAIQRTTYVESEARKAGVKAWRDIHDYVLTRLLFIENAVEDLLEDSSSETWQGGLVNIIGELKDLSASTRALASQKQIMPEGTRLPNSLRSQVDQLQTDYQPRRHFHLELSDERVLEELPTAAAEHLSAIVYEAVANGISHGDARNFWIQCFSHNDHIVLEIENDGHGFDPLRIQRQSGLVFMRQRVEEMGAELQFSTNPGRPGVTVTVLLPVQT